MQVRSLGRDDPLEDCSNPLHYSCLENPMDRGGVEKSQTQLSDFHCYFDANQTSLEL